MAADDASGFGFETPNLAGWQGRRGEKWSTYAAGVLPAWVAEMDFPIAPGIADVLRSAWERSDVGYPRDALDEGIPVAFATRMSERFDWRPDPALVVQLADVVQGIYLAIANLTAPRAGIVVQTPIYPPFLDAVAENGRQLIENRLVPDAGGFAIDFDALEAAAGAGTEMLLLCHPHNPTGRAFRRDELERLAALALARDWIVVSDEIHADLVFDGRTHIPFASLAPEVARRTITLTSATKAFNIPGLRLAVAHFGDPQLRRRFEATPAHARGGISLLGIHATLAAWQGSAEWLDAVRAFLVQRRDQLVSSLRARIPELECYAPEATYLAWVDAAGLGIDGDPAAFFHQRGRVAFSAGPNFGAGLESCFRINFATSTQLVEEIVRRMEVALERGG